MREQLEAFWREAPFECPVCFANRVTKKDVLKAIAEGADTLEKIKKRLPLCANNECKIFSPDGSGCEENAEALLDIYAPVWKIMKDAKHRGKN